MSYIAPLHQGLAYGDATMSGTGTLGQAVKVAGNNVVAPNTGQSAGATASVGLLAKACADGAMPVVLMNGGVYETDTFTATDLSAGDALSVGTDGLLKKQSGDELVVARALSVASGVLVFRLLI
jgi:hypothetical protein